MEQTVGFRFCPTDEELIDHYLRHKNSGRNRAVDNIIREINVCKREPWELPGLSMVKSSNNQWFFFWAKDRKNPSSGRRNRMTGKGFWKGTGVARNVYSSKGVIIGKKQTLVFHLGRGPGAKGTEWIIHEYSATKKSDNGTHVAQGGYVIARLFKKQTKPRKYSNSDVADEIVSSSILSPPLENGDTSVTPPSGLTETPPFMNPAEDPLGGSFESLPFNPELCALLERFFPLPMNEAPESVNISPIHSLVQAEVGNSHSFSDAANELCATPSETMDEAAMKNFLNLFLVDDPWEQTTTASAENPKYSDIPQSVEDEPLSVDDYGSYFYDDPSDVTMGFADPTFWPSVAGTSGVLHFQNCSYIQDFGDDYSSVGDEAPFDTEITSTHPPPGKCFTQRYKVKGTSQEKISLKMMNHQVGSVHFSDPDEPDDTETSHNEDPVFHFSDPDEPNDTETSHKENSVVQEVQAEVGNSHSSSDAANELCATPSETMDEATMNFLNSFLVDNPLEQTPPFMNPAENPLGSIESLPHDPELDKLMKPFFSRSVNEAPEGINFSPVHSQVQAEVGNSHSSSDAANELCWPSVARAFVVFPFRKCCSYPMKFHFSDHVVRDDTETSDNEDPVFHFSDHAGPDDTETSDNEDPVYHFSDPDEPNDTETSHKENPVYHFNDPAEPDDTETSHNEDPVFHFSDPAEPDDTETSHNEDPVYHFSDPPEPDDTETSHNEDPVFHFSGLAGPDDTETSDNEDPVYHFSDPDEPDDTETSDKGPVYHFSDPDEPNDTETSHKENSVVQEVLDTTKLQALDEPSESAGILTDTTKCNFPETHDSIPYMGFIYASIRSLIPSFHVWRALGALNNFLAGIWNYFKV